MSKSKSVDLNETPKSLPALRKFLSSIYPELSISRHHGVASYYWHSETEKDVKEDHLGVGLATCYSTTIGIAHWSQLTYSQWQDYANEILSEAKPYIEQHKQSYDKDNLPKKSVGRPRKGKEATVPVTVRLEPSDIELIEKYNGSVQRFIELKIKLLRSKHTERQINDFVNREVENDK